MEQANIISALEGSDLSQATEVTYGLDGPQSEAVLVALRRNLESHDPDLVEITAMRLGVRFKDAESFQKIANLALTHHEELVVLAALKGLSAIPERHPHLRNDAEATLQTVIQASSSLVHQVEAAREYLRLIGESSTRQYVSEDEATVLARYRRRRGD